MIARFQLLVCSVAVSVTSIVATGCGAGSDSAIPTGARAGAVHDSGGYTFRTIFRFKNNRRDGTVPTGRLIAVHGVLYGTTYLGGRGYGGGTVFSLTSSGAERVLHTFKGGSDGADPDGGLVDVDGVLYGMTRLGGDACGRQYGCGTVFAVTRSGQEHVIYRFKGGSDGNGPTDRLTWLDGKLYGVTSSGGSTTDECAQSGGSGTGCGTVFSVDTSGNEQVVYRFRGQRDGSSPHGSLLALGGKLYGTTDTGGADGSCDYTCGTLFEVTTSGVERVLHRFTGSSDGSNPTGGLLNVAGVLYGTTASEGGCCGTVFKATTSGAESPIYAFKGAPHDAGSPNGMLVADHNLLYGTAVSGGKVCGVGYYDSGAVFAVSTAGAEQVVHTFSCRSNFEPSPGLLPFGHALYGTTDGGYGSAFALTP